MTDAPLEARRAALRTLAAVLGQGLPADTEIDRETGLEPAGRAFARRLVTATLRNLGRIDDLIARCLSSRLPKRAGPAHDILRLGTAQLLFLDIPPHAAVSTSVDLARTSAALHFAKLVNAVLRRLSREGAALLAGQDAPRLNTPDWLWAAWTRAYGAGTTRRIAEAHLIEPPLDLSARDDADRIARSLEARLLPTGTLRRAAGVQLTDLAGFADGAWWVQDAAAALPARLLGDVAGRRVADLCAAPGGKTAQLAAVGAKVTAVERAPARMAQLRDNLGRLRLEAETVIADFLAWRPDAPFDAVLLDAPCSATGTIRRHPDVAWLKKASDVRALAATQGRMLEAAAKFLVPGGSLVYCVCSLQPEEGPERIARFLAAHPEFRRRAIDAAEVGGLAETLTPEGDLRTLPCHLGDLGGMDGFYAARLIRR